MGLTSATVPAAIKCRTDRPTGFLRKLDLPMGVVVEMYGARVDRNPALAELRRT